MPRLPQRRNVQRKLFAGSLTSFHLGTRQCNGPDHPEKLSSGDINFESFRFFIRWPLVCGAGKSTCEHCWWYSVGVGSGMCIVPAKWIYSGSKWSQIHVSALPCWCCLWRLFTSGNGQGLCLGCRLLLRTVSPGWMSSGILFAWFYVNFCFFQVSKPIQFKNFRLWNQGYQLINSSGTLFLHSIQQCRKCLLDQYILDSNDPRFGCMSCPAGATCEGGLLRASVEGSTWIADLESGQYVLKQCPKVLRDVYSWV